MAATAAFDDIPPDPGLARFFPGIGYGTMLIVGALAASAMIASIAVEWLLSKTMPTWVPWLGFVCALALLGGVVFLPMAAWPLWAIVVAVVLLSRERPFSKPAD